MKKKLLASLLLAALAAPSATLWAQRIQQPLGRGVVAVKNGSSVFVSWRKLAQEPEGALYNLYCRPAGAGEYTKVNSSPLGKTNYTTTTSKVADGSEVAVALVVDGVEQPLSAPFLFKGLAYRSEFLDITFENEVVPHDGYTTKFIWPADLDGDGEYDYVLDRQSTGGESDKVQAYRADGTCLWTIDMGPNVTICRGHNDMVVAYDMNCDGRAEVVIKSSDGTRFWDSEGNRYGDYLLGKEDTDGDGIVDYTRQSVRNPPQYITCVDGLTGREISTIEMPFPGDGSDKYSRTNKQNYLDDDYSKLNGHMGIAYLDGVHPSVVMEYMVRTSDKTHHYYVSAWGYRFEGGRPTDWVEHFTWSRNDKRPWPAEFHHIRVGDVDLDGMDETLDGGFAVDHDGKMLFSAGISHGDRFRMSDIDPERPGLETYAIQQNAGDMLGEILYDAATGEPIVRHYLSAVGDVGRGECMDVDKSSRGYEFWSTMGTLYSCDGKVLSGSVPFPREGVWWDGELDREMLSAPDGNGANAMVQKYDGSRLIEMAKLAGWGVMAEYGCRPAFFGDIVGDWRDEVILRKKAADGSTGGCTGIMGFSTDYATDHSLYCLQEEPAYRMQCTTRGYYQSPFPAYYLGYDMPAPPLPPCMVTDLVWSGGGSWQAGSATFTNYQRSEQATYADGKSVLLALDGDASQPITLSGELRPSALYAMPPAGVHYTLQGEGTLGGAMQLWKSQNGTLTLNSPMSYSGATVVSEGVLELNSSLAGPLELRAKGTLAGNAQLNDTVIFEGALNSEGCRLKPGSDEAPFGTITFNKSVVADRRLFFEADLQTAGEPRYDRLVVHGDFTVTAPCVVNVKCSESKPAPGEYPLVEWTGSFFGEAQNLSVSGLTGLSCGLKIEGQALYLVINAQRTAAEGVYWRGSAGNLWDYQVESFWLDGAATAFVAGDKVIFDDEAASTTVQMDELLPVGGVTFANEAKSYTLSGEGGISGEGSLEKRGKGNLLISATKNDYTGATILNGGTVTVAQLSDGGQASSIGAAASDASLWQMGKTTLVVKNANTATDRGLTLNDTATINVPSGTTSLKGIIKGGGTLVKSGSGQLNITYGGDNSYTGGTILKGGTLAMGAYNTSFGKRGSAMLLEGGTVQIFNNNSTSAVPSFNYAVTVPQGKSVKINAGQRCSIGGSFSGGGSITLDLPYVRADMKANWSSFTGSLTVTGNQFRLATATDMSGTALTLGDGIYMGHFSGGSGNALSATSKIGSLATASTSADVGNGSYIVGYDNTSVTYAGKLSASSFTKEGEGTWTLTGSGSAPITVNGGVLLAANKSAAVTSGLITVNSGAALMGSGIVNSVKVNSGGVLGISSSDYSLTTLTLNGSCTVAKGGVLQVKRRSRRNDSWTMNGTVTLNSPLLRVQLLSGEWAAGDSLVIFAGSGKRTLKGELTIEPAIPAEGLEWDASSLIDEGVLRVVAATGIGTIEADLRPVNVYSAHGVLLREQVPAARATEGLARGVYIVDGKKRVVK